MSYLDNLETVRKKDLLLPEESKEYLDCIGRYGIDTDDCPHTSL